MKKTIFALLILTTITNAIAQNRSMRFGLNLSPSLSWNLADSKFLSAGGMGVGYKYGLVFDYRFADNFWLGTGLDVNYFTVKDKFKMPVYADKGLLINNSAAEQLNSVKYNLQYLEIPITLKMKTKEIGSLVYFGQFGLNGGFRLSSKATYYGAINTSDKENANADINFLRAGLNIGGGAEYTLTESTSLIMGLNFNNGFTNSYSGNSDYFGSLDPNKTDVSVKNVSLSSRSKIIVLTVGVLF